MRKRGKDASGERRGEMILSHVEGGRERKKTYIRGREKTSAKGEKTEER